MRRRALFFLPMSAIVAIGPECDPFIRVTLTASEPGVRKLDHCKTVHFSSN